MAERILVNLYVECTKRIELEKLLEENGYLFYDGSEFDDYCREGLTLKDVISELEG
jgi:hypothetical protein